MPSQRSHSVRQSDYGRLLAVGSGKGGTGKTTVAAGLAYALAHEHGRDVALVDFDPQGSSTRFTGQRAVADPLKGALGFLQAGFGSRLSSVVIRRGAAVAEAHERLLPVTAYAPDSPPAVAIRAIADELVAQGVV